MIGLFRQSVFGRLGEDSDAPSGRSQDPQRGCRITLSIKTGLCYRFRWLGGVNWEIPVNIGAKVLRRGRYVTFQLTENANICRIGPTKQEVVIQCPDQPS